MSDNDLLPRVRRVLKEHGRLSNDADNLGLQSDLYEAGMTSHASVNVMLALENEFDIEFPDQMLRRNIFGNIESIVSAVATLTQN